MLGHLYSKRQTLLKEEILSKFRALKNNVRESNPNLGLTYPQPPGLLTRVTETRI